METFYKWRVQEKDKRGRLRWRIVKSPMTESTARFWAANNDRVIERIDTPVTLRVAALRASGESAVTSRKTQS